MEEMEILRKLRKSCKKKAEKHTLVERKKAKNLMYETR
jgi:hypothetical protein